MLDMTNLLCVNTTRGVTVEMEVNVIKLITTTYVEKEFAGTQCVEKDTPKYANFI
jgi:hypothetical protein